MKRQAREDCKPGCASCFYCESPLALRHEHDHHLLPFRNGGTAWVATCLNCHDLKDRMRLNNWRDEVLGQALREAGPLGRILLAKLSALMSDYESLGGAA